MAPVATCAARSQIRRVPVDSSDVSASLHGSRPNAERTSSARRRAVRSDDRTQGAPIIAATVPTTCCCDIALAAPDAVFGFSEVRLGIIPGVISPMVLAKIGPAAARRYFLTGERFDAKTALRIGLVDEVAADPDEAVDRVVEAILDGGPTAVREAKRLALEPGDEEDLLARAAERRASPEGQEGLRAFLDSRGGERVRPSWQPNGD